MAFAQVVAPRVGIKDGIGWCLRFTQSVFAAPVAHPSARAAWNAQLGKHPGQWPPAGVAVPIWFDHWGTYGTPARYDNWGHVAVSLPDGTILTSPFFQSQGGQARYPNILAMMRDLGGKPRYLGWSEYMNGQRVVRPVTPSKPAPGQEEDEDMIFIRKDNQNKVYAWSPSKGSKRPIGTTEWNAIKRAYGAAGLKLPIINTTAAETKHFGI